MVPAAILCGLALAAATGGARVTLEPDVPIHDPATSSWINSGRAPSETVMDISVVLTLGAGRRQDLERKLFDVSDPNHPDYGRHLSKPQIAELLAVPEATIERVRAHFFAHGAKAATPSVFRDVLAVTASVQSVEAALATTISTFTHKERSDVTILRASAAYSLPATLAADVDMAGELLQFPALRVTPRFDGTDLVEEGASDTWPDATCGPAKCVKMVTPAILGERYTVPVNESTPGEALSTMAVAEFQGQYFRPADLVTFSTACSVDVSVSTIVGGNKPIPGVEAMLDIEYIKAMSQGTNLTVVYSQGFSLLKWAEEIMALDSPPLVHSVSYGNDEKQQSGGAYMDSVNTAFMKAGTLGLSILFASGDQGVCGREGCGVFKKRFKPDFPGGSPYHTSVGGTDFAERSVIGEETTWSDGGGGFSDHFDIPAYQAAAVASFKNISAAAGLLPPQTMWNNTGRGYPDVAALGGQKNPYCVVAGGRFEGVAGTSASTPVVAGIFARLNGLRLAAGKPPLGFLNPFIYQNAASFNDITTGSNEGCGFASAGWPAAAGWDAVTGVGTPNYAKLAEAVARLP
jgi:tripeptidyl-peptidase-1